MSWLRLDDGFAENPKIASLSEEDAWRWVRTLLYCARRRDPELRLAVLTRVLGWEDNAIEWLVELELLDESDIREEDKVYSYRVHDWHVYNSAKSDAERMSEYRDRKYGPDRSREHGGRRGKYAPEFGLVTSSEKKFGLVTSSAGHIPRTSDKEGDVEGDVRHGESGSVPSSVTSVTASKRNASVTTRAQPRAGKDLKLDLSKAAALQPSSDSPIRTSTGTRARENANEILIARLLATLGDIPPEKVDYIRGAGARLPEAKVAGVLELVSDGGHVRDKVGYVIGAFKREIDAL